MHLTSGFLKRANLNAYKSIGTGFQSLQVLTGTEQFLLSAKKGKGQQYQDADERGSWWRDKMRDPISVQVVPDSLSCSASDTRI